MENERFRTIYQTLEITIANGFSGNTSAKKQLDDKYDFCDGVALVQVQNSTAEQYGISIEDKVDTFIEPIPYQLLESNGGVSPNLRYKDIAMPIIGGYETNVKINVPNATTSEVKMVLVFRVRRALGNSAL